MNVNGITAREAWITSPVRCTIRPPDLGVGEMSLGDPFDGGDGHARIHKYAAEADADRALRSAGYKSPFRRLLERLRPHRQEQGGDPQGDDGTRGSAP